MLGVKLKTKSGRFSESQKWQLWSILLQSVNVSALVAFGFPTEYVAAGVMIVQAVSGYVAMRYRMITSEPMK